MITINSNGIPESIRAAGRSPYRTPRMAWWGWVVFGMALTFLGMSMAHASPACMTHHQAKQVWPNRYLHWRGEHCWSYGHHEHRHVERKQIPKERPDTPVQEWIYSDRWWLS